MFKLIERRLCDWFDANDWMTEVRNGEWVAQAGEEELSITAIATALAKDLVTDQQPSPPP